MNTLIQQAHHQIDFSNGSIAGKKVLTSAKRLKDMVGIFEDKGSFAIMDTNQIVYSVQAYLPVEEGKEGGLFYGKTTIEPGKVGDEYFMTLGHFHRNMDRAEFYWGIQGKGILLFMDEDRKCRAEEMKPGSLHYIPGKIGHRTINTGSTPLHFGACWPSDAGHNYEEILQNGFPVRVREIDGQPQIISVS